MDSLSKKIAVGLGVITFCAVAALSFAFGYNATINAAPNDKVDVEVLKSWQDGNPQGLDAEFTLSATANGLQLLYSDLGLSSVAEMTKTTDSSNRVVWTDLPKYHNGTHLITYNVTETDIGYDTTLTDSYALDGSDQKTTVEADIVKYVFEILNEPRIVMDDIVVKKIWDDNNNVFGQRPPQVMFQLYQQDTSSGQFILFREISVNGNMNSNEWTSSIQVPTTNQNGLPLLYTVREDYEPQDYISEQVDDLTIKNTFVNPQINITVEKIWDDNNDALGIRPSEITISLFADGVKTQEIQMDSTYSIGNNTWQYQFQNLPMYGSNGVINYTVEESTVPGYTLTDSSYDSNSGTWTFRNTARSQEYSELHIDKTWDYLIEENQTQNVYFELYRDGVLLGGIDYGHGFMQDYRYSGTDLNNVNVYWSRDRDTEHSLEYVFNREYDDTHITVWGLPVYNPTTWEKYRYHIIERSYYPYNEATIYCSADADSEYIGSNYDIAIALATENIGVKNTFGVRNGDNTPKGEFQIKKAWNNDNGQTSLRPVNITVLVSRRCHDYENWEEVETVTITSSDNWETTKRYPLNNSLTQFPYTYKVEELISGGNTVLAQGDLFDGNYEFTKVTFVDTSTSYSENRVFTVENTLIAQEYTFQISDSVTKDINVKILKVDSETDAPLENAYFDVYDANGTKLTTTPIKTDAQGKVTFTTSKTVSYQTQVYTATGATEAAAKAKIQAEMDAEAATKKAAALAEIAAYKNGLYLKETQAPTGYQAITGNITQ